MKKPALTSRAGFDLLWDDLGRDVRRALQYAFDNGAVFRTGRQPLAVFRAALDEAVRNIEGDERGQLIQRFVTDGPYEHEGPFPASMVGKRLTDAETAAAVSFVHGHVVNCFQGALAELLAVLSAQEVLAVLTRERRVPRTTRLYVGDSVRAQRSRRRGAAKAADFHLLAPLGRGRAMTLVGIGEVKSFTRGTNSIAAQVAQHAVRAGRGLSVEAGPFRGAPVHVPSDEGSLVRFVVRPPRWRLPRGFRIDETGGRVFVVPEIPTAPPEPETPRKSRNEWMITLRWSHEALAAAAYGISFWYMEQVGSLVFRSSGTNPWPEMTPAQAGVNAAQAALYYAIRRARPGGERERAVAIYNTYGFGYALGMNFRDRRRRRQMLWPQDLREIKATGRTDKGCRIIRSRFEIPAKPEPT